MTSKNPSLEQPAAAPSSAAHTIAIAATFTAEPVEAVLTFWSRTLEMPFSVSFAPYHQVFQQLLDPTGVLARNRAGLNVLLLRWEDWGTDPHALDGALDDLIAALRTAVTATSTPLLLAVCPASRVVAAEHDDHFDRLEIRLRALTAELSRVHLLTTADMLTAYPVQEYDDAGRAALGHVPYTPVFFAALGTLIARHWYALQQTRYKVIALDCDETLWKGVCGEVGPHGVKIETAHEHLQRLMVAQQQAGMLLCLNSKNNEEDVDAVFEQRGDMTLGRHHLVASRINWRPKSENLRSLAAELRVGLDSFIFIDDDPVSCADVEANCPDVLTLPLPEPLGVPRYLDHIWAFDRGQRTEEDAQRTELYRSEVERERSRKESLRFDEFFAKLGVEIELREMQPAHFARVAQLTQRTNQFNCTTIRRTEDEVGRLAASGQLEGVVVEVRDRFGAYGLVGVVLFRGRARALEVDTFLLSCRALGRGVEHRMLSFVGELAQARACECVEVRFRPSGKNLPAHEFLESLGQAETESTDDGVVYRLSTAEAAALRFQPGETAAVEALGA
ncbi:MAG: HAD-IIIC family phosphatase, partial [Acidobacteria bacterium]|nr:HAD-IIIC family phosphatase [Acidobacteriota bacterium]